MIKDRIIETWAKEHGVSPKGIKVHPSVYVDYELRDLNCEHVQAIKKKWEDRAKQIEILRKQQQDLEEQIRELENA